MKAALIQILMGAIGTLGFSIYFRVSERNVAAATFGGALGWGVYLLCFHLWGNVFAANVVATAVVYFWSVATHCASTSNRNFEDRQGFGAKTHLCSPAMAAAAAIAGRFVDVRQMHEVQ